MRFYELQATGHHEHYDCAVGFVVAASSEQKARLLASKQAGDEGPDYWLDPATSQCKIIRAIGNEKVILRNFHNG